MVRTSDASIEADLDATGESGFWSFASVCMVFESDVRGDEISGKKLSLMIDSELFLYALFSAMKRAILIAAFCPASFQSQPRHRSHWRTVSVHICS